MRHAIFAGLFLSIFSLNAWAFDYSHYKSADLDEILKQPRPQAGATIVAPQKLMLDVRLMSYPENCDTGFLKTVLVMQGVSKQTVDTLPLSKCVMVKTANGNISSLFIQDGVAEYLSREIPLDGFFRIFADYLFIGSAGPGILLNEFQAPNKP